MTPGDKKGLLSARVRIGLAFLLGDSNDEYEELKLGANIPTLDALEVLAALAALDVLDKASSSKKFIMGDFLFVVEVGESAKFVTDKLSSSNSGGSKETISSKSTELCMSELLAVLGVIDSLISELNDDSFSETNS